MANSDQWSTYLNRSQYAPASMNFHDTQVNNHEGTLGQATDFGANDNDRANAMMMSRPPSSMMSRPPSSMDGITDTFGFSGDNQSNSAPPADPLSPTETYGQSFQLATPAHQGPGQPASRSTLQDLLAGPQGRSTDTVQDMFSSHTPLPANILSRSGGGNRSQFLDKYSATLSLDATSRKQLGKLLELPADEQAVMVSAIMMKILQNTNTVMKATSGAQMAMTGIPHRAASNIARWAHRILLIPEIEGYESPVPHELLMKVVKKRQWDLPVGWSDDDEMLKIVTVANQEAITQRKSTIKQIIENSCGIDLKGTPSDKQKKIPVLSIVELSRKLLSYGRNSMLSNTEVTTELCARVAYLRKARVDVKQNDKKYWKTVSDGLEELRKRTAGTPIEATRALACILDEDRDKYKRPDLSTVRSAMPSALQSELAALATTGTYNGDATSQLDEGGEESDRE